MLWEALRARRFEGLKFRRQHTIGPFVVDFYCEELRVAIEIDGGVHAADVVRRRDAERQRAIEADGVRVVRVLAADVERDVHAALSALRAALTPRPPLPARRGEGESERL